MTHFQLLDTAVARVTPDIFGVWETAPSETVSFAAPDAPPPESEIPVWSVNLPADASLAATQLDARLAQVNGASRALGAAAHRLDTFVQHTPPTVEVSFAVSDTPLPSAEQGLLNSLGQLQTGLSTQVSFGLLPANDAWGEAEERFKNVLTRLTQSLAHFAFVETHIENRLIGRTTLSWSSDAQTLWQNGLRAEQWELHQRTLALSVQSRAALMQTVALTAQSAVKISAMLALPGGALLALPAAWKFINAVLSEVGSP